MRARQAPWAGVTRAHRRWLHCLYLDYVSLAIRPLRLQIEQNTTARLIRFARVFEPFQALLEEIEEQAQQHAPVLHTLHEQGVPKSGENIDTPLAYGHFYIVRACRRATRAAAARAPPSPPLRPP